MKVLNSWLSSVSKKSYDLFLCVKVSNLRRTITNPAFLFAMH